MKNLDKMLLTFSGTIIMAVVLFFVVVLNPGDELNYDKFVIVRHHDIGDNPSKDIFYVYNYGLTFRIMGPTFSAKVRNAHGISPRVCKAKLFAMLRDTQNETRRIIEIVDRDDLLEYNIYVF